VRPNEEGNSQSENRSEITPEEHESNSETKELDENEKKLMHLKNERPRKRSAKRCNFCRKRRHIQKECPCRQVLQNWLWNDEVPKHTAEMPGVEDTVKVCEHTTET